MSVDRRAKYLLVRMSSGALMILHLGMSGRLAFFASGTPRAVHDHLRFGCEVFDHLGEYRRIGVSRGVDHQVGLPCIVGTKIATSVLKDGELVELNANHGILKKV